MSGTGPRVYLDHHATTPCDPEVVAAMLPYFGERFGNASSTGHRWGREARDAVEEARVEVAHLVGGTPKDVVLTSGATEAINLALKGLAAGRAAERDHIITVATEHSAVLEACDALAAEGLRVTRLPVGEGGRVDPAAVEAAMDARTLVVCVMAANNEIGVIQPLAALGRLCRARAVPLMTDAAQAVGWMPFDVDALQADLVALSAHKIHGPKGVGALYVRRRACPRLAPLLHGGGHERGLRAGTVNVPGVVGFGVAARRARGLRDEAAVRVGALRDRLWSRLQDDLEAVTLNGDMDARLPNNLNVSFAGVEARVLLERLPDVACSSGSACTTESLEPSHVLRALGLPAGLAFASVRLGLGWHTTEDEVAHGADRIIEEVRRLRSESPLWSSRTEGR